MASFTTTVSPPVAAKLHEAELLGLRGQLDEAHALLVATAGELGADRDDDRVAIGELSLLIWSWGDRAREPVAFIESLAEAVQSPSARGALLFARGRAVPLAEAHGFHSQALDEFAIAGNLRGRAVTLSEMCWLREDGLTPDYRIKLGLEGLRVAESLDDPWAVAFCAGRVAATETYFDRPEAMARWERATSAVPDESDSLTREATSLNMSNWALTAWQHGDYRLALRLIGQAWALAYGSRWADQFEALRVLCAWRQGRLADVIVHHSAHAEEPNPYALSAYAAAEFEQSGRLTTRLSDTAVAQAEWDIQMRWLALATQAAVRAARREPSPLRGLRSGLAEVERLGVHFGWEDMILVQTQHDPGEARAWRDRLAPQWPSYARGAAVRSFVDGLVAQHAGYDDLLLAAERFEAIGEPVTRGQALHAAARVAPTIAEGNELRQQAIELFQSCGADRSLAAVLRERRLHRGENGVEVPASQRNVATAALTDREREVALLAAKGFTGAEIAEQLNISLGTTRNHLAKVREKFGGVPKRMLTRILSEHPVD